jgi:excisionase family DNA binding protein
MEGGTVDRAYQLTDKFLQRHPFVTIDDDLVERMQDQMLRWQRMARERMPKPKPKAPDGWLKSDEIVELTGLKRSWIYDGIKAGDIQAVKIGNSWRIDPESAIKFAETIRRISGSAPNRIGRDGKVYLRLAFLTKGDEQAAHSVRWQCRQGHVEHFKLQYERHTVYVEEVAARVALAHCFKERDRTRRYEVARMRITQILRAQPLDEEGLPGLVSIRKFYKEFPDIPHRTIQEFMRMLIKDEVAARDLPGWYRARV